MIETLGREIGDTETGVAFLVTAFILGMWGMAAVISEYRAAWRHWSGWRLLLPPTFSYYLGLFLLCDAVFWLYLGVVILTTPDRGVPLWSAFYFGATALVALRAFQLWARESLP